MEEHKSLGGPRTACHNCEGQGFLIEPQLAVISGEVRTVLAERECVICGVDDDAGWLPGFVIPA